MTSFSELIPIDKNAQAAIYVQIANGMVGLIRDGVVKPGSRLPSVRALAAALEVHPKTVVAAYQELTAQDWVYSKPRSGMGVAGDLPQLKTRGFCVGGGGKV